MKIQFLIKYNDTHVAELQKKIAQLGIGSYDEMMDFVASESTSFFAPFVYSMREAGHDTKLIIPNLHKVQHQWCIEHSSIARVDSLFEVAKEQIKDFKPDVLYLSSNFEFYSDFLKEIKPSVNKIFAWISCPFDKKSINLEHIDHIFTLFKPHYDYFLSIGKSCSLMHAVFDDRVLDGIENMGEYEVSFVGGIGGYHRNRERILKKLVKKTPILLWGYGFKSQNKIKNVLKQVKYLWAFTKPYQGEAWGRDMLQIMYDSKITFNTNADISAGHAVNMRLFEATGVGTLLVTEYAPGIEKFFIPEKEVICYKTADEAIKKIKYYLEHEDERNAIALAGKKKTLENYTFKKVTPIYLKIFEEKLLEHEEHHS